MQEGFPEDYYTLPKLYALYHACTTIAPRLETLIGDFVNAPTCVISDLGMLEAHKVAIKFGVSSVAFSTQSALALSAKYYCPRLIDAGLLPLPKISDDNPNSPSSRDTDVRTLHTIRVGEEVALLAREVTCVPGMYPLRLREYYSPLLVRDLSDPMFQALSSMQVENLRARDWILMNTFYELEAPIIDAFHRDSGMKLTNVGPLVAATVPNRISTHDDHVKTINSTDIPSGQFQHMWHAKVPCQWG